MKLRLLALSSFATCALVVACSGADPESAPASSDGADGGGAVTTPQPDAPAVDSGTLTGEEDAGLITEGGGDPEVETDAGGVADAGVFGDGGTCGPATGNGALAASACSSTKVAVAGGVLTPGTYDLTSFTVTGDVAFCSSYTASNYSGRLDVTADGLGGFTLGERTVKSGGLSLFPNRSFSATPSGSFLKVAQICGGAIKSTSWGYTVTTTAGKPTIIYTHDSGTATVRYRWVMR